MLIGENHKIESDDNNIILSEKRIVGDKTKSGKPTANPGEEKWDILGYYSTPENALTGMVDHEIRQTDFTDFQKIVSKQDELYNLIKTLRHADLPRLKTRTAVNSGH